MNCDLSCRYQREEAKIQAWVNLQSAKAEAQSKKLEACILLIFLSYSVLFICRSELQLSLPLAMNSNLPLH